MFLKKHLASSLFITSLIVGCASKPKINGFEVQSFFTMGAYNEGIEYIEKRLPTAHQRNKIIYYLDLGILYQAKGDCRESNKYFNLADRMLEIDYSSTLNNRMSKVFDETLSNYSLSPHEALLINVYKSINYICLGDIDGALVEMKKVDLKQSALKLVSKVDPLEKTFFASYLSGMFHESQDRYDEAVIDYKRVYRVKKYFPYLYFDLYRSIALSGRSEDFQKFYKRPISKYSQVVKNHKQYGEILILYHTGLAPLKVVDRNGVPSFVEQRGTNQPLRIRMNGKDFGKTHELLDIYKLSKLSEEHYLSLFRRGYFQLGNLETRTWDLLPQKIQVARLKVPRGEYYLSLTNSEVNKRVKVKVKAGASHFINLRSQ